MPKPTKNRPQDGEESDEDNEYYKRPTLAERIGPEEARRMLMDDDEDENYTRLGLFLTRVSSFVYILQKVRGVL